MDFEADRDAGPDGDPSLADMTRAALAVLQRNPRGFFLFVEGGRIDHAHHYNNAYRALDETLALESALLAAMELVDVTETLIVLTADHSHVLTLGGLATPRGNPILGKIFRFVFIVIKTKTRGTKRRGKSETRLEDPWCALCTERVRRPPAQHHLSTYHKAD
ncbi:hypothetical protein FOCC_FOCC005885, partial [Frankliniella occidentalis]